MYKIFNMLINSEYQILNSSGNFVNFLGIEKKIKKNGLKITLENGKSIVVSDNHIFIANNKNMFANALMPNVNYLTTKDGDFYVKKIEKVEGVDFFDIVDSENCDYFANDILNHNCSFLGSGDNFIAEEFLKRIEEKEISTPIFQQYTDKNFWIWENPIAGEEYIMGVDASAGHGDDNSTINILKVKYIIEEQVVQKNNVSKKIKVKKRKTEQVAEYYGKVTPQLLAEIVYQFGIKYNNAYVVVDITGGYGVQTVEKLIEIGYPEESIHYAEINHKPSRDRLQGYIKKGQKILPDGSVISVDLIPGFFIGNNRPSVLLDLQRTIHLEDIIIRSVRLLNELKTFVTVPGNRVADHKRSFHDDSIMGLSIALYVLNFDMSKFKQNKNSTKKTLDALLYVNDPEEMTKRKKEEDMLDGNKEKIIQSRFDDKGNPDLQKHIANAWLFNNLKSK